MKLKYLSGLVVAVVAVSFAVFVAAHSANDNSNTNAVKGAQTQKAENKDSSSSDASAKADTPAVATEDTSSAAASSEAVTYTGAVAGGRGGSKPADEAVLAIVTKPAETPASSNGSNNQPVEPTPAPTPVTPSPTPVTPTPTPVTPTPVTPTPAPTTGNLIANPSVETAVNGQPADWTFGSYGVTATSTYDTTAGSDGTSSLKVAITALDATAPGDAKWLSKDFAVTAGQTYQVSNSYKATVVSQVDVIYKGAGLPDLYNWIGDAAVPAGTDWAQFSSSFTVPAGYTSASIFHAIKAVGSLSTDNYSVTTGTTTTPTPTPNPGPATGFTGGRVSLTFDDGLTSTYLNGMPLLKKYNMVSTQYWISDTLLNNANYGGDYMTIEQAKDFLAQIPGTEVGSHTVYHCDLTGKQTDDAVNCPLGLSASDQAAKNSAELAQSKADLDGIFGAGTVKNIASPYGGYDAAALTEIQGAGYASHRSVEAGFNTFGAYDKYVIKVQNVEATTTVAQVKAWVDQAVATNTWLVLVYHDVDTVAGAYGVTTGDLDQHLAYIQAKGVKVETVAQALAGN